MGFGWMLILVLAILVPYYQTLGLSMRDVFEIQAFFSGAILIFELPSGYISDLLGRKKTILMATFFHAIGFALFPFATTYWDLVLFQIVLAFGLSLFSGTDVAIIYDSMEALGKKGNKSKLVGNQMFFKQIGETVAAIIGGLIAAYGLREVVLANTVLVWLPFFLAFFITEPPRVKLSNSGHRANIIYIYKSLFKQGSLLILILLNTVVYGVATLVAVWSFQPFWKELGVPIIYFGLIWALSNLTVALVAKRAHLIEIKLGSVKALILMAALPIAGYGLMSFASFRPSQTVWVIIGVLSCSLFQTSRGLGQVLLKDALNSRVTGDMRATANSVSSLGLRLVFIGLGPLMGHLMDSEGMAVSFGAFAGLYIVAFIFILLPLVSKRSEFKEIT